MNQRIKKMGVYRTIEIHEKRNKNIAIDVLRGVNQATIAKSNGLSKSRISQVVWNTALQAWPEFVEDLMVSSDSRNLKLLLVEKDELIKRIDSE